MSDTFLSIAVIIIALILAYQTFKPSKWFKKKYKSDPYCGFKEITIDDDERIKLYANLDTNIYDCLTNEYLLVRYTGNEEPNLLKWTGTHYEDVKGSINKSAAFGSVKAKDAYQRMAIDSFSTNKVTLINGSAGTGKTYLSLSYLFGLLEKGKLDRIIVFCNTVDALYSAKLGYLPGTKDQKLLDSAVGYMLASKLGGTEEVLNLIEQNKLVLLPMSQIRGYDTTGMKAGIYISEAQNLDVSMMKLALQRIGEDCVVIIDGDCAAQVDDKHFEGTSNGMRRVSTIFKGESIYGEVELQNIFRSRVANIAERL